MTENDDPVCPDCGQPFAIEQMAEHGCNATNEVEVIAQGVLAQFKANREK